MPKGQVVKNPFSEVGAVWGVTFPQIQLGQFAGLKTPRLPRG